MSGGRPELSPRASFDRKDYRNEPGVRTALAGSSPGPLPSEVSLAAGGDLSPMEAPDTSDLSLPPASDRSGQGGELSARTFAQVVESSGGPVLSLPDPGDRFGPEECGSPDFSGSVLRALEVSPAPGGDRSPGDDRDLSLAPGADVCLWCGGPLDGRHSMWCSKRCRQTAWRARQLELGEAEGQSLRVAYADPPFPGMARRYYGAEASYAGEVDHARLVSLLEPFDGWALSTSEKSLQAVLRLCPAGVRVAPWTKPIGVSRRTRGPHNAWEPVVYKPARLVRPGVRDWLNTQPARGGGRLKGRKPLAFCRWLFRLLGMQPRDRFVDLFPGTRIVAHAWAEVSRCCSGDLFPRSPGAASDLSRSTRARTASRITVVFFRLPQPSQGQPSGGPEGSSWPPMLLGPEGPVREAPRGGPVPAGHEGGAGNDR